MVVSGGYPEEYERKVFWTEKNYGFYYCFHAGTGFTRTGLLASVTEGRVLAITSVDNKRP
jgi:phosphoribosylamine-glycine ligase